VFLDLRKHLLFDVQTLHDDFNNPVALGNPIHVVLEVAGLNQARKPLAIHR